MIDSADKFIISNLFSFEEIVQFPLDAIIRASANSNHTVLNFLDSYCFRVEGGKRVAKTFTFYYSYLKGGVVQNMRVEIPIISLITIPYYTINSAKFNMGINIISIIGDKKNESDPKIIAMLGNHDSKINKEDSDQLKYSQVSTNMNVEMEVVPSDFPAGLLQLLNFSSQGIDGKVNENISLHVNKDKILMSTDPISLTIKCESNSNYNEEILLTIQLKSNFKDNDFSKEFNDKIEVNKGDIIGDSSYDYVQILSKVGEEVEISLFPSGEISTNGYLNIYSPLTTNKEIYYRIKNVK